MRSEIKTRSQAVVALLKARNAAREDHGFEIDGAQATQAVYFDG
jgi:hypothetical protein